MRKLIKDMLGWAREFGHSLVFYTASVSFLLFLAALLPDSKKLLAIPAYAFAWMVLAYISAITCGVVLTEWAAEEERRIMSLSQKVCELYFLELWGMGFTWVFSDAPIIIIVPAFVFTVIWVLGGLWYQHAFPILPPELETD